MTHYLCLYRAGMRLFWERRGLLRLPTGGGRGAMGVSRQGSVSALTKVRVMAAPEVGVKRNRHSCHNTLGPEYWAEEIA